MATPAQSTLGFLRGIGRQFISGVEAVKETAAEKAEEFFRPTTEVRPRDVLREIGVVGKKVREVLQPPKDPEEAKKQGFVNLKLDEQGQVKSGVLIDPLGLIGGIKKVGKKVVTETAENVIKNYLRSKVTTEPTKNIILRFKDKIHNSFQQLYTSAIDRFNPIVNITREAKKFGTLFPGESPEFLARRYLGSKGIAESKLFWKVTDITPEGNLIDRGKSLSDVLEPVRNSLDDLRTLMIAERDVELAARVGKQAIKGVTPIESTRAIQALQAKWGNNFKNLSKVSDEVREFTRKAILDPLRDVGWLSNQSHANITKSNKFYTPFQRVLDDLENAGFVGSKKNVFQPKGVPIKKIKGSELAIIDPLESIVKDTYRVTEFVERARVAKSVVNLRNIFPEMKELIKPVSPKIIPVAVEKGKKIFRPSFLDPGKNTIMVFEDGKRKFFKVSAELAKSMEGMSGSDMGLVTKILGAPARTLRAGAVLSPEFIGRNPLRDQMSAFIFSKYGYVPGVDLVKGIFNMVGKKAAFNKWLAAGGAQSMFVSLDRIGNQRTLQEVASKGLKGVFTPQGALNQLKKTVKEPLRPLRALSELSEKGTRVGLFRRAKAKGVSDLEAMFESRDSTLDFARIGSQIGALNKIIAFFNANVQDISKLTRSFRERPLQTGFKAVLGLTIPSITLYLTQRDNPRYQEVPQFQKDLFWIIVLPEGTKIGPFEDPIIRIPKPFLTGTIFGTVPERILTWMDKNDPEQLRNIPSVIAQGASPGFIPTAMLPILENVANYSFFRDRPIVSQTVENLPVELQSNTYTSQTAREIGKIIKKSPAKIENLVNGYFAGLGRYALDTSDFLLEQAGLFTPPPSPTPELADIPFIKAFITREPIGNSSESVNRFFIEWERIGGIHNAAKRIVENEGIDAGAAFLKQHPEESFFKGFNKIASDMSEIRKTKDLIFQSTKLNPKEKRDLLTEMDRLMTELARQTLAVLEESGF